MLTVNGTEIKVDVDPRHTLADTLRAQLRLTGVHLGCEHGVCGMCTVLVDGHAVRSCLLFTVQLEGADVITVEALGRPGELHPIQRAFHTHHALQCGFCNPSIPAVRIRTAAGQPDPGRRGPTGRTLRR